MKKSFVLLLSLFLQVTLLQSISFPQTSGDYRSKATGNWNATGSWEKYNGSAWIAAVATPTSADGVVTILSGHTITVNVDVTADQVVINSGGTLSNSAKFSVSNGTGTDLSVNGTLTLSSGSVDVTTGSIAFGSGSVYRHQYNGGSIPTATWDANSLCEVTGIQNNALNWLTTNQVFGNFTWNCTAQSIQQDVEFTHIQGNLTISSNYLRLFPSNTGSTLTVDGNLTLSGSTLDLGFNNYGITQLILKGNLIINSGTFTRTYTTGHVDIVFSKSGTQSLYINSSALVDTYMDWTINSSSTVALTVTSNSWDIASGRTLTLNGTLDCYDGSKWITGAGNFTSGLNSTLYIYDFSGITTSGASGQIQVTGTKTYNAGANYYFKEFVNGGNALTSAKNITIDNSSYTLTLETDLTVSGDVTLTNGKINLSAHTLTLGSTSTLNETSSNYALSFSTGKITTTRNISNVTSENVAGMGLVLTTAANLGSTTIERHHNSVSASGHTGIKRWYKVTPTNNVVVNATVVFNYLHSELNGCTEGRLTLYKSEDNSTWQSISSTLNTTNDTHTATGVDSFSYFTLGDSNSPLPVELTSFKATTSLANVYLNWSTATEVNNYGFEIQRQKTEIRNQKSEWENIGFVQGSGNSNSPKEYSFTDTPTGGQQFQYRLKQIDFDGKFEYSETIEVKLETPANFALLQNFPNPFNPSTIIRFELPKESNVTLKVFNILGEEVTTLINKVMTPGRQEVTFDGSKLASGMYIYRIQAGNFVEVKKLLLLK